MTRATIVGGTLAAMLGLLTFSACNRDREQGVDPAAATSAETAPTVVADQDLIYGRVTTDAGDTYEGRLRFGGDEEALWGNYFNGVKDGNPWSAQVPGERLTERRPIKVFGVEIGGRNREIDLGRPFMARFGDIARLEANGRDLRVTLKSGTVFELDRFSADDYADGVRVWDGDQGVVDLDERRVSSIELLPTPRLSDLPEQLYGTVRTALGDFTGFVQWDRKQCLASDVLVGRTSDGEVSVPFQTIRSIARSSSGGALVSLIGGSEVELSSSPEAGIANRGIYVDDPRYGRVLISWDAFERVDFSPGNTGPAYGDYQGGRPITGSVITRSGSRLSGRLVYDLDESETTETLDAPSQGVDYTIPFGLVGSIVFPVLEERGDQRASVTLHSGEVLQLERSGDLAGNAGVLVFLDDRRAPEYVPWTDVEQIVFDRPPET